MKAFIYEKYGPPEVLELTDIPKPVPGKNEVLVKIEAVSLNMSDYELLTGKPLFTRVFGLFKPENKILGSDIAGTVEAVGEDVKYFNPGDEVFGDVFEYFGGFAEYAAVPEKMLTLKPDDMNFETASSLPQSGVIALQGIKDEGKVTSGKKVLINGAGGGAGTFALQLAKLSGAEITAVDSGEKLDLLSSLGAKHVIDYKKEDFTKNQEQYDFILDLAAYHSIFEYKRKLKPGGKFYMVGGSMKLIFQLLFLSPIFSLTGKGMRMLALKKNKDLDIILELVNSGKITPVIDKVFSFNKIPEALKYLGEGHAKGKVIITMNE